MIRTIAALGRAIEAAAPDRRAMRVLAISCLVAVVADVAVFVVAGRALTGLEARQALAFAAALAAGALAFRFALRGAAVRVRVGAAVLVLILAYVLRAGVLSLLVDQAAWSAAGAIVPASVAGAAVVLAGGWRFLFAGDERAAPADAGWAAAAALVVLYLLVLRLVYLGQLELTPQEAYYWNFARHLDIGYLDHPPLTAWMIAASTAMGASEFWVRLPALASSLIVLYFVALLARDLGGASIATRSVLLAALLPFFFGIGVMMTPDAPLTAAWAAALYFLHRALVQGDDRAWIGAGLAIGAGMLAKYTMILVPLAVLAFAAVDARARRVLWSPWTWAGAALALAVFSPVVLWNLQHDWASFTFQGSRRLATESKTFGLHLFAAFLLIVVTPWGIVGLARGLKRARALSRTMAGGDGRSPAGGGAISGRALKFAAVFTFVPLVPLAITSVWTETKFHWTGPIWLAALPVIAMTLAQPRAEESPRRIDRALAATWPAVLSVLMVVYAVGLFYYPVYGIAGVRAHHRYIETGWRDMRLNVQQIEEEVTRETGRRPAVVGLDKHNMASEMAYYDPRGDGYVDTASRSVVFDEDALMYEFWFSPRDFAGRDLIVVSCRREEVEDPRLAAQASRMGPTQALAAGGSKRRDCYARVLYGFTPSERPQARSKAALKP